VVWTDGKVTLAEKEEKQVAQPVTDDLPF